MHSRFDKTAPIRYPSPRGSDAKARTNTNAHAHASQSYHTINPPRAHRASGVARTPQQEFDQRQLDRAIHQLRMQAAFDTQEVQRHIRRRALQQELAQLRVQREADWRQLQRNLVHLQLTHEVELRQLTRETSTVTYVSEPPVQVAHLYSAVADQLQDHAQPLGNAELPANFANTPVIPLERATAPVQLTDEALALLQLQGARSITAVLNPNVPPISEGVVGVGTAPSEGPVDLERIEPVAGPSTQNVA